MRAVVFVLIVVCFTSHLFVDAQNTCPSFLTKGNVDVNEREIGDSGAYSDSTWAFSVNIGAGDVGQQLQFTVTNTDNSLFDVQPRVDKNAGNSGTLSFTIKADVFGSATVTVTAKDDGGTAGGGCDTSTPSTFTLTINAVNDPPTYNSGPLTVTVNEDSGAYNSPWATGISAGPSESAQQVGFVLTLRQSAESSVFSVQPQISPTGQLTFTPAANQNSASGVEVYVSLTDDGGGGNTLSKSCHPVNTCPILTIVVTPVNDLPSFTASLAALELWENLRNMGSPPSHLCYEQLTWATAISAGPGTSEASQTVSFTTTVTDGTIFRVAPEVYTNGSLIFCLAPDRSGTSTIRAQIRDDGAIPNVNTVTQDLALTVLSVNSAPYYEITGANPITVARNSGQTRLANYMINVGPARPAVTDESGQGLTVTAALSPASLGTVSAAYAGGNVELTLDITADQYGGGDILFTLKDDGGTLRSGVDTTTVNVPVTVTFVSNPPTITLAQTAVSSDEASGIPNGTLVSYTFPNMVSNVGPGSGDTTESTALVIASSDAKVMAHILSGNLVVNTEGGWFGSTIISFTVTDGAGLQTLRTLTFSIGQFNKCPDFSITQDVTMNEDDLTFTQAPIITGVTKGLGEDEVQTLSWSVTTDNSYFDSSPSVVYINGETTASVAFQLKPNAFGSISVQIVATDSGGQTNGGCNTRTKSFNINIAGVNDRPSYVPSQTAFALNEDEGPKTYLTWAQSITYGPFETTQVGFFNVTLVNPAHRSLFAVEPAVSGSGDLSFTMAGGANTATSGPIEFVVQLVDNSGTVTANSCDYALCPRFRITVASTNSLPSFVKGGDLLLWEDLGNRPESPHGHNRIFETWATSVDVGSPFELADGETVTFDLVANDTVLFATLPRIHPNGTLDFTLKDHRNGVASISVTIRDSGILPNVGTTATFIVQVLPVNDPPVITLTNTGVTEIDENSDYQNFTSFATVVWPGPAGIPDEIAQSMTVKVNVNPSDLFEHFDIFYESGVVTLGIMPKRLYNWGTATGFISLQDNALKERGGEDTTVVNFTVKVLDINDPPSLELNRSKISILEDAFPSGFTELNFGSNITSHNYENSYQDFDIKTTNTRNSMFSKQPEVDKFGTLSFTVKEHENGQVVCTVTVTDKGSPALSVSKTFQINVAKVNDCPVFALKGAVSTTESTAVVTVEDFAFNISRGPTNEDWQALTWTLTTNNDALFEILPTIQEDGEGNGTLTFQPKKDLSGIVTVSVAVQDNAGTSDGGCDQSPVTQFLIIVNSVNNVPFFVPGAPKIQVAEDAGPYSAVWATGMSPGASNEATQSLWFDLKFEDEGQRGMFKTTPQIDGSTGVLTFEPNPDVNTFNATIKMWVVLYDNGNASQATPSCQTGNCSSLEIEITPVNDPPFYTPAAAEYEVWENLRNVNPVPVPAVANFSYALSVSPGNALEQSVENQTVQFAVTATNVDLFMETPTIDCDGTLHISLREYKNGVSVLSIQISDSGPSPNVGTTQSLTVRVLSVNDPPHPTLASRLVTIVEDAPLTGIGNLFTSLFAGPPTAADENTQTVTFEVAIINSTMQPLFQSPPTMDSSQPLAPKLMLHPTANAFGFAWLRLTARDNGGTARSGVDVAPVDLQVEVVAVNDAPTFSLSQSAITVLEDSGFQNLTALVTMVSAGPFENASTTLHIQSTNPSLFSQTPQVFADGRLEFTPAPNAFGSSDIDIHITDAEGMSSATKRVVLEVIRVNDPPRFDVMPLVNVTSCKTASQCVIAIENFISNINAGASNENQGLSYSFTLSPTAATLFEVQPQIFGTNTLSFTLKVDAHTYSGPVTLTITATDTDGTTNGGVNVYSSTFALYVTPVIDPPAFDIPSPVLMTVKEDAPLTVVNSFLRNVRRNGFDTSNLIFYAETQQAAQFLLKPEVTMNQDGVTASLRFQVAPNEFGTMNMVVTIYDPETRQNGTSTAYTIRVLSVNDAPTFDVDDIVVHENSGISSHKIVHNVSLGTLEPTDAILSATISCTQVSLFFVPPTISIDGTVVIQTKANASGSVTCGVTLRDTGGVTSSGIDSTTRFMTVTLLRTNRAPRFVNRGDVTVLEDAGSYVTSWATNIDAGALEEASQVLSFHVNCDGGNALFTQMPSITPGGTLSFVTAANANGAATCTAILQDNGVSMAPSRNQSDPVTFRIVVIPVNDAPLFTRGPDVQAVADEGVLRLAEWATGITTGPANEASQTLTFSVESITNAGIFVRQPTVEIRTASTADLVVELNASVSGFAAMQVCSRDNGGTENGGVDKHCETVSVSVAEPVARPEFSFLSRVSIREDSPTVVVNSFLRNVEPNNISLSVDCSINSILSDVPVIASMSDLVVTPAPNAFGAVLCSLRGLANNFEKNEAFVIDVLPVNDAPSFDLVKSQFQAKQGHILNATLAAAVSVGPANEASQRPSFQVTSDHDLHLYFSTVPTMTETGVLQAIVKDDAPLGTVPLRVTLMDDGGSANGGVNSTLPVTVVVVIEFFNRPPLFIIDRPAITMQESPDETTIPAWIRNVSAGSESEATQSVSFTLSVTDDAMFVKQPMLRMPNYDLVFQLANHRFGNFIITVRATDSLGVSSSATAELNVLNINDSPSFTGSGNVTLVEDSIRRFDRWASLISAGPYEDGVQTAHFEVTNFNTKILESITIDPATGNMTIRTTKDGYGTTWANVSLIDNGGLTTTGSNIHSTLLRITVTPSNDPPQLEIQGPVTVGNALSGDPIRVSNWVIRAAPGPLNELSVNDTVTLVILVSNSSLFAEAPVVDGADLLFAPAAAGQTGAVAVARDSFGSQVSVDFNITVISFAISLAFDLTRSVVEVAPGESFSEIIVTNASGFIAGYSIASDSVSAFSTAPSISSSGALSFVAATRPGFASVQVMAFDASGAYVSSAKNLQITVRVPVGIEVIVSTPTTSFDPSLFRSVIAGQLNVTQSQVIITGTKSTPTGGTAVEFYVEGTDWTEQAPQIASALQNPSSAMNNILNVQSASVVNLGTPAPEGPSAAPRSPDFEKKNTWVNWGYVLAVVFVVAVILALVGIVYFVRSKSAEKKAAASKASAYEDKNAPPTMGYPDSGYKHRYGPGGDRFDGDFGPSHHSHRRAPPTHHRSHYRQSGDYYDDDDYGSV